MRSRSRRNPRAAELAADSVPGGAIVIGYVDYRTPGRWVRYDPKANALRRTGIVRRSPGNYSDVVVERVLVPSLDGTVKIPLEVTYLPRRAQRGDVATGRAHRLRRVRNYNVAALFGFLAGLARRGRGLRASDDPRRRRVRRGLAPRRALGDEDAQFRRPGSVRAVAGSARVRRCAPPRDRGWQCRRLPDGDGAHARSAALPRRRLCGRLLRLAARRAHAERRLQYFPGVRNPVRDPHRFAWMPSPSIAIARTSSPGARLSRQPS